MRKFYALSLFVFLVASSAIAQDTITRYPGANRVYNLLIAQDGDTTLYTYSADSTLESTKKMERESTVFYTRYYPNGNVMWTKEFAENQPNGALKIYSDDNTLLGSFELENDSIVDTLFLHKKRRFIYGRFTYYSIVYGGMQREDGTSNISGGPGVQMHYPMYAVRLNPEAEGQTVFKEFFTDYNGYFMLEVPSGKYGIFPVYYSIDRVTATMGCPQYQSVAMESTWSINGPIDMTSTHYRYLFYHYHSIGYAP